MNISKSYSIYCSRPILAIFLLGIASGVPLSLVFSTLTMWLSELKIDKATIGIFAGVGLAYSLKFLWSPVIDGIRLPFFCTLFGPRGGWLIFTQLCLACSIIALGASNPEINIIYTAICAVIVAFFSATQDIIIDAYRVEILKDEEQAAGASSIVLGYRLGTLFSGAGALFISSYYSWFLTYFVMAIVLFFGSLALLVYKEKNHLGYFPSYDNEDFRENFNKWFKISVLGPLKNFFTNKNAWLILFFIFFYKFGDAFAAAMNSPFYLEIGFSKIEIGSIVKSFGFAAIIIGAFIGSIMVTNIGIMPALFICGILQMLSNLLFIAQFKLGYNIEFLAVTIAAENLSSGMGATALVVYLSKLCNVNYTATQYALLSAIAAGARSILTTPSGFVAQAYGWELFFIFSTIAALPGIILLIILWKKEKS